MKERGLYQGHCSCPGCGSSDAGALYKHNDETYSLSCFSAGCDYSALDVDPDTLEIVPGTGGRVIDMAEERIKMKDMVENLCSMDVRSRKMKADAYEEYGVLMDTNADGDLSVVYYPTYRGGEHCGYRNRKKFESWMEDVKKKPELEGKMKCFYGGVGDLKLGIEMFGQWLFPKGGKRIIITMGEEDAIAGRVMTKMSEKTGRGYPVVSVPSGENIKGVKPNLEYITSFEEIYILPDNDEPGKAFCEELCKLLPVTKVKIMSLPDGIKDASALWTLAKSSQAREKVAQLFYKAIWDAESYSPAGIMGLSSGWDRYMNRGSETLISFPDSFGDLNYKTHGGYALKEIVNIIAASSIGKSSIVKEMIQQAILTTPYNIGVISLEEDIAEFIEGQLSIHTSTQLNELDNDDRDRATERKQFEDLCHYIPSQFKDQMEPGVERINYLDHQGSCSGHELLHKIDFLINGLDCKIIIVDPVTLAFSGKDTDEDEMASEIVKRTKRHNIAWVNVHHVRKNSGGSTANSEGADLSEEDIKGSGSWFQTAMINLIFTRNKTHENPTVRNTLKGVMSKCRRHGKNTGTFGYTYYNGSNGRLELGRSPEEILEAEGGTLDDELNF